ncbi:MAG TPA: peptide ABC transporter substrate-binding protein [Candidatus Nitrosotalea sp.]|nr:peptide ABC transporter substrate-binding protein [Candidatus Nitrosotalea sp.]
MTRFLALALAVAAGCSRATPSGGWGSPHVMTIARSNDPSTLNPLFAFAETDIDLAQLYAEPLVGLGSQNEPIPMVAKRVPTVANRDVSRDGRTVTYHLRENVRFSDGVPLTSKDVAFTYRAILDPRNPVAESQPYREIAALDTPDPHTVVLRLRRPWAGAVAALFATTDWIFGILPAHAFTSTDIAHAAWNDRPFGSGPFRVVRWRRGDEIDFEPNPYAWRKPRLRRLVVKIVPDRNTELLLLQTHAVDVAEIINNVQAVALRTSASVRLVRTEKNRTAFVAFQTRRFPTDDARVRRGLMEAIDNAQIVRKVYYGLWPVATTEIPTVLWAHDASVRPYSYSPAQAARDLEAAGWRLEGGRRVKNGSALTVDVAYANYRAEDRSAATVVQENLARLGVEATVRGYPSTVYFSVPDGVYYGGRFNLAVVGWYGGMDPEQSEYMTCDRLAPNGPNTFRWCDAQYDRLFALQSQQLERQARHAVFSSLQKRVAQAALFVPLIYQGDYSAINPAVRGWHPTMTFEFCNSDEWDVLPPT